MSHIWVLFDLGLSIRRLRASIPGSELLTRCCRNWSMSDLEGSKGEGPPIGVAAPMARLWSVLPWTGAALVVLIAAVGLINVLLLALYVLLAMTGLVQHRLSWV